MTRLLALVLLLLWPRLADAASLPTEPLLALDSGMHTAAIRAMDLSADGKLMVTGSDDKTIRVWAMPDGRLVRTMRLAAAPGKGGKIYAIDVSPDGNLIAAGGWDAAAEPGKGPFFVTVLSATTGEVVARLGPEKQAVVALSFSPDGKSIAAGFGRTSGVRIWSVQNWKLDLQDRDYADSVYGLSFSRDGSLAVASEDGSLRLYGPDRKLIHKQGGYPGHVPFELAFAPDGQSLAVGYLDAAQIDVLSSPSLQRMFSPDPPPPVAGQAGGLTRVSWSGDGKTLFGGGEYGDADGHELLFAWGEKGKGARRVLAQFPNAVGPLRAYGTDGLAYATLVPSLGLMANDGKPIVNLDTRTADPGQTLAINPDATGVVIGMDQRGTDAQRFDLTHLSLAPATTMPGDFHQPDSDGLPVSDWPGPAPKLGGNALALEKHETANVLAILPDKSGFFLGTNFAIVRFDAAGQQSYRIDIPDEATGLDITADGKIVVAVINDGTVRWYRTSDGQELLSFFIDAVDRRWVAWTPSGYYAASAGGENLIGWQLNRGAGMTADYFPASKFHDIFYRPDIVQRVLPALDEAAAIEQANVIAGISAAPKLVDALPPVIHILSPKEGAAFTGGEVSLRYSLRSPSGLPVDAIEVLQEGSLFSQDESKTGRQRIELGRKTALEGTITVKVPPHDVDLSLVARAGQRRSVEATLHLAYAGKPVPASASDNLPRLQALVIGVNSYDNPDIHGLQFAVQDARSFADQLHGEEGKLYRSVDVRLLTDKGATRTSILDGLNWLENENRDDSVTIFYLAGHGVTDERNRFFFLPSDVDLARLKATAVNREDIQETLGGLHGKVLALVDTCQSGAIGATAAGGAVDNNGLANELAGSGAGVVVIAAARGREQSQESDQWGHGAFTKALLDGLGGAATSGTKGTVNTASLFAYVEKAVPEMTHDAQHPVMLSAALDPEEFALASGP